MSRYYLVQLPCIFPWSTVEERRLLKLASRLNLYFPEGGITTMRALSDIIN